MEVPGAAPQAVAPTGTSADVVSALVNLGYEQRTAEQAVERATKDAGPESFEGLLRASLQQLSAPSQKGAHAAR
jgi:Holliday junction DNA helicase RuvA